MLFSGPLSFAPFWSQFLSNEFFGLTWNGFVYKIVKYVILALNSFLHISKAITKERNVKQVINKISLYRAIEIPCTLILWGPVISILCLHLIIAISWWHKTQRNIQKFKIGSTKAYEKEKKRGSWSYKTV